jgi:hypothetical protein
MTLTPEAVEWGTAWYEKHYENMENNSNRRMEGYNARLQTHIHKVAMILSLAKRSDRIIGREDLQLAERLLGQSEAAMETVLTNLQAGKRYDIHYATEVLISIERRGGTVRKNALYGDIWATMGSGRNFDQAVTDLVRAGKLRASALPGGDLRLELVREEKKE